MIGILVVTHGNLGKELINSAELIVGKQENTFALGLYHGDNIDDFREKVAKYSRIGQWRRTNSSTDLYGVVLQIHSITAKKPIGVGLNVLPA